MSVELLRRIQPPDVIQKDETPVEPKGRAVFMVPNIPNVEPPLPRMGQQAMHQESPPPAVFPSLPGIESKEIKTDPSRPVEESLSEENIPSFLFGEAPLKDIKPPHEREKKTDEQLNTEYHETFHGFAAIGVQKKYGIIAPVSLSVHPDEKSKGRAVVYGEVEDEYLKIVAAAGAINPPGTRARGYGKDFAFIDGVTEKEGGRSREDAFAEAAELLKEYSVPVLRRSAEILAAERMLTPDKVSRLARQAVWELYHEGVSISELNAQWVIDHTITWTQDQWDVYEYTVIEDLGEEQFHIQTYWDKGPEWFLCGRCQSFYDQEHTCPGITNEDILPTSTVEELIRKTYPTDVFIAKSS